MSDLETSQVKKNNGHGGARPGAGQPPFQPTDAERKQVEAMSGFGVPFEQIAALVRHGIDADTLKKAFAKELVAGKAKANSKVGQTLFQKVMEGDTAAAIWWSKSQMRWKEVQAHEITGKDGAPIQVATIDVSKISTSALAEIMAAKDASDPS